MQQATLTVNATRRFRYTSNLKRLEESKKNQSPAARLRASTHVIRVSPEKIPAGFGMTLSNLQMSLVWMSHTCFPFCEREVFLLIEVLNKCVEEVVSSQWDIHMHGAPAHTLLSNMDIVASSHHRQLKNSKRLLLGNKV